MAEFQEVIEQFKRLCDSANQDCSSCGLGNMSCCMKDVVDNSVEVEKRVMAWAAEHPEPVYPSIAKYLEQFGIIIRRDGSLEADFFKAHEPMSADLAEKLGVKPKEG